LVFYLTLLKIFAARRANNRWASAKDADLIAQFASCGLRDPIFDGSDNPTHGPERFDIEGRGFVGFFLFISI
jgi:hypothetical protein